MKNTESIEEHSGWRKYENNPVLGGKLGTCFDVSLLKEDSTFRMWFSWRPRKSLALVESTDGIHWSEPVIVLEPNPETDWEKNINRPAVLKRGDDYHMWYTGQSRGHSWLGYATSSDGIEWTREGSKPVLSPEAEWEKVAVMCPHVIWDEKTQLYRMWYSGGEQYEPDAIGYATSPDGRNWTKLPEPIFSADPKKTGNSAKLLPVRLSSMVTGTIYSTLALRILIMPRLVLLVHSMASATGRGILAIPSFRQKRTNGIEMPAISPL